MIVYIEKCYIEKFILIDINIKQKQQIFTNI